MSLVGKNIICLEPWHGEGISERDTGLGNRIIHWSIFYYISCILKDYKIIVEKKYWPELDFLELPNTEAHDIDYDYLKTSCKLLSLQDIKEIIYDKKLDKFDDSSSYYSDTFMSSGDEILSKGIGKIKFKNEKVNDFFKTNFSNLCSLHLRRGLGAVPTVGFIKDFLSYKNKKELKEYINEYYFRGGYWYWGSSSPKLYKTIPDSVYFSIINEIISVNTNQNFYISADITENYYSYYFDRYPNNFITSKKYFKEFLNLCEYNNKELNAGEYSLKQTLLNLFDLFVLSSSNTLIIDSQSTWGVVASFIFKQKKKIDLIEYTLNRDCISYEEFVKKYSYKKVLIAPWAKFMS